MNGQQLRQALESGAPVIYDGTRYRCVSAIIYRRLVRPPETIMQAELMDVHQNSVVLANPKKVELDEEEETHGADHEGRPRAEPAL